MSLIDSLDPYVQFLCRKHINDISEKLHKKAIVSSAYRSMEEQAKAWAQGRTTPGEIITKARPGESMHNYRLAYDLCIVKDGKADWNDAQGYRDMGALGQALGLTWGGSWKTLYDAPHYQWTGGLSLSDLQVGKKPVAPMKVPAIVTLEMAIHGLQNLGPSNYCVVKSTEYWLINAVPNGKVKGEYAAVAILNFVAMFKIVNNIYEGLEVLKELGVVNSPDYWFHNAKAGCLVEGAYAAALLMNMYHKIRG